MVAAVQAGTSVQPHYAGGSMVSYWAGAWCSRDTFVTAGTTGAAYHPHCVQLVLPASRPDYLRQYPCSSRNQMGDTPANNP